jgi:Asp-tRNA(Asn)/Glu-tRNA(Gln) amidotransferase A subunit family amidase
VTGGKLATHEFAWVGPSTDLPRPPARNPWDTARFTGGFSCGTGAVVAAGIVCGGTGSDTGGSVWMPAAFRGVAGIKPTYGPRIGLVRHFFEEDAPAGPGVRAGVLGAAERLRALGAEVREMRLPSLSDFNAAAWLILMAEAHAVHEPWLRTRWRDYGGVLRGRLATAASVTAADHVQAQRRHRALCAAVAEAMREWDLLLTASEPAEAPLLDRAAKWASFEAPNFTTPFKLTGQPAMALRAGFGEGGPTVGVQIAGRPFEDALVLRAAHALERATEGRDRRPAV